MVGYLCVWMPTPYSLAHTHQLTRKEDASDVAAWGRASLLSLALTLVDMFHDLSLP
jgi:hypothetical protein